MSWVCYVNTQRPPTFSPDCPIVVVDVFTYGIAKQVPIVMADPVSGSVEVAQMRPRPQSRKSVATMPFTASGELDNQTTDISQLASLSATSVSRAKKSRSKSLGPGGLEALKEATGNRRKVPLQT